MAERELLVENKLSYEGLFSAKELIKLIDNFFREKGYDKREIKNAEKVTPEGKFVELEIMPWKKVTDYAKNEIWMRIIMENIKEVEVEKNGVKAKLNQGTIKILFYGYLTTDYENRWEQKPMFFFIRTLFDKFFLKQYVDEFKRNLIGDMSLIKSQIEGFLNLYRYRT